MLQKIFEMQADLNDRIIPIQARRFLEGDVTEEERNTWFLNYSRALIHESVELEDSCLWKWWSKDKKIDLHNIKIEVVDLWHFLVSLTIVAGMTPEELFKIYEQKWQVNHERQDKGYSRESKDGSDNLKIQTSFDK